MFENIDATTRERIIAHIETALAYDADTRKRKIRLAVDSKRPSSRIMCPMCQVGIRPETAPVNGMHPRCAKVAADPSEALKMPMNGHAARCLLDSLYGARRREGDESDVKAARDAAHKELLARFEIAEAAREKVSKSKKASA